MRKSKRLRPPADVTRHLAKAERVLSAEPLASGGWALITRHALIVADDTGVQQRAQWHEIDTGQWQGDILTFTIIWADRVRPDTTMVLTRDEVDEFTGALRERVQSSVVHAESIEVGRARVRATVRRRPDNSLYSQVTAFGPLRHTPQETAAINELERRVREAAGLPT